MVCSLETGSSFATIAIMWKSEGGLESLADSLSSHCEVTCVLNSCWVAASLQLHNMCFFMAIKPIQIFIFAVSIRIWRACTINAASFLFRSMSHRNLLPCLPAGYTKGLIPVVRKIFFDFVSKNTDDVIPLCHGILAFLIQAVMRRFHCMVVFEHH